MNASSFTNSTIYSVNYYINIKVVHKIALHCKFLTDIYIKQKQIWIYHRFFNKNKRMPIRECDSRVGVVIVMSSV